eukprot:15462070-Alexandrium_andersonii.AAC.1
MRRPAPRNPLRAKQQVCLAGHACGACSRVATLQSRTHRRARGAESQRRPRPESHHRWSTCPPCQP